jgi:hypothetical protein
MIKFTLGTDKIWTGSCRQFFEVEINCIPYVLIFTILMWWQEMIVRHNQEPHAALLVFVALSRRELLQEEMETAALAGMI